MLASLALPLDTYQSAACVSLTPRNSVQHEDCGKSRKAVGDQQDNLSPMILVTSWVLYRLTIEEDTELNARAVEEGTSHS